MKINHNNTKELIKDCLTTIREQAIAADTYKKKRIAIESDQRLARDYQQKQIDELRNAYFYMYDKTKETLKDRLDKIEAEELKNEAILELDIPEYANSLSTVVAAKGKLPEDVVATMLKTFAGHHQLLCSLESVFEQFDVKTGVFSSYTMRISEKVQKLKTLAGNIERSEVSSFIDLNKLYTMFVDMGEKLGLSFPDDVRQFTAISETVGDAMAREAMGLSD
ncbi:MAG: hypothetical protein II996_00705 [Oscillospiraceae bacterium]|nr:hypothetical protein [Oscillospiraceae bacterium]